MPRDLKGHVTPHRDLSSGFLMQLSNSLPLKALRMDLPGRKRLLLLNGGWPPGDILPQALTLPGQPGRGVQAGLVSPSQVPPSPRKHQLQLLLSAGPSVASLGVCGHYPSHSLVPLLFRLVTKYFDTPDTGE